MTTITQTILSLARIAGVYRCPWERYTLSSSTPRAQAYAHLLDAIRAGEAS